jgi:hypothetical protein
MKRKAFPQFDKCPPFYCGRDDAEKPKLNPVHERWLQAAVERDRLFQEKVMKETELNISGEPRRQESTARKAAEQEVRKEFEARWRKEDQE